MTSYLEIKKRFNFQDQQLKIIGAFKPQNALSGNYHNNMDSLLPVFLAFLRVIIIIILI